MIKVSELSEENHDETIELGAPQQGHLQVVARFRSNVDGVEVPAFMVLEVPMDRAEGLIRRGFEVVEIEYA